MSKTYTVKVKLRENNEIKLIKLLASSDNNIFYLQDFSNIQLLPFGEILGDINFLSWYPDCENYNIYRHYENEQESFILVYKNNGNASIIKTIFNKVTKIRHDKKDLRIMFLEDNSINIPEGVDYDGVSWRKLNSGVSHV